MAKNLSFQIFYKISPPLKKIIPTSLGLAISLTIFKEKQLFGWRHFQMKFPNWIRNRGPQARHPHFEHCVQLYILSLGFGIFWQDPHFKSNDSSGASSAFWGWRGQYLRKILKFSITLFILPLDFFSWLRSSRQFGYKGQFKQSG